ncbi:MAG: glycosyltransferase, partial [Ktedonobacteraceae bacterium]
LDIASSSSSWGEAFPNAIGEAMACAVPCIATDVGDVREIIADTGIVVPPSDPEVLCAGWIKLADMGKTERRKLGEKARQRILDRYTIAAVSRQYTELYQRVGQS